MATGMEMMLKMIGLNPDEIKEQISGYGQLVLDLHNRIKSTEEKVDRLLVLLEAKGNQNEISVGQPLDVIGRNDGQPGSGSSGGSGG